MNNHPLNNLIDYHKQGFPVGLYSVCSANPFVLKAAMLQAREKHSLLLIESTSNQVDQLGGYTGLKPADFKQMVFNLAAETGYAPQGLILGGDHLGPNRWQNLPASEAMQLAGEQVAAYVKAGFSKIHLDTTMALADDSLDEQGRLAHEIIARRSAELCAVAEKTFRETPNLPFAPLYVIGSDVPPPGGAHQNLKEIRVTPVEEVRAALESTYQAFKKKGLEAVWPRVRAVVVQPGVEFDHQQVFDYQRESGAHLSHFIEGQTQFVYEAHSTDYQLAESLRQMVEDHFVFLKVGPALTFALREALFALSFIEKELLALNKNLQPSGLMETLEQAMLANPQHWQKHYRGSPQERRLARQFSFSDRIRYYWPDRSVRQAIARLIKNLNSTAIPLTLLSQFLPDAYRSVRRNELENQPEAIILHKIQTVLEDYLFATGAESSQKFISKNQDHLMMEHL